MNKKNQGITCNISDKNNEYFLFTSIQISFKDTHRENTPSNKSEMPLKMMNMYVWAIGTLVNYL